ncbi:MAG: type II secretion system F family protein [Terracidiphilus sp.]|nr:type II secretion system F family protein [Terracidiphilus sp.]MDR3798741.1 type II secretion system F family protein [Terracidiphilus sp.]
MEFAIFAFVAVFLLIASGGLLLFYREVMLQRISEVIHPRPKEKSIGSVVQQAKSSIGSLMESVENLMPRSDKEVSIVVQRLTRAGFRNESAVKVFYGCKVAAPILLSALALVTGLASMGPFFVYLMTLGVGFLAPDFWLGKKIKKRQKKINRGLPDVLDLLVICMEAGLSLDQATARTAQELTQSLPELCDELNIVVLEQHAGRGRADAWKHMAERTAVESVRNLVSMLVQTEQFGTSIAKVLRVHSDSLRVQRVQMIEELASKTSVKLVFPLVLFIFPALFLVTLGPAAILMVESFSKLTNK